MSYVKPWKVLHFSHDFLVFKIRSSFLKKRVKNENFLKIMWIHDFWWFLIIFWVHGAVILSLHKFIVSLEDIITSSFSFNIVVDLKLQQQIIRQAMHYLCFLELTGLVHVSLTIILTKGQCSLKLRILYTCCKPSMMVLTSLSLARVGVISSVRIWNNGKTQK